MCTGRVDLSFVLRAFQRGADGVIIARGDALTDVESGLSQISSAAGEPLS